MRALAVPTVLSLSLLACATGETVDDLGTGGSAGYAGFAGSTSTGGASGSGGSGASGVGGFGAVPSGGTGGGVAGSAGNGGASSGGTSSGGTSSGGTGGAGTGGGGTGGTGGSGTCGAPNSCSTATPKGSLTGDEGPSTLTISGKGSTFITVRITEDNHSVIGEKEELKLSLSVPSGEDLDIYAYVNTSSDSSPCGLSAAGKSDSGGTGANESFSVSWGEGTVASGNDDSRDVVIEVAHKSGSCDQQWTLLLTGDP
ncbi:MAG: hypothetical protein R3B13_28070 [Polyangiaceae bacterium]